MFLNYFAKKIIGFIFVLLGISVIIFFCLSLAPGDPVRLMVGPFAGDEEVEELRKELGLDRPLYIQYFDWLGGIIRGDLGRSLLGGTKVKELLFARLPATIYLAISALFITLVTAFPIGIFIAIRYKHLSAKLLNLFVLLQVSSPPFWVGLILILIFSSWLGWFPTSGYSGPQGGLLEMLRHLILPAITLSAYQTAWLSRTIRSNILEVLRMDYVRTARAKGLSEYRVVLFHVLRNSFIPILTVIGLQFGYLMAGTVVVEDVFAWPGIGRLLITEGIYRRDIPIVQGVILFITVVFTITNFSVDLLYAWLNPQIRYD